MSLEMNKLKIEYLVNRDIREDIDSLDSFFKNKLKNDETLRIREFLKRKYIFVSDGETERQFTAFKKISYDK